MPDWVIWAIAAGVLATGEVLTLTLFLGPIAIAAALAAVVAATGVAVEIQVAVFLVASVASLAFIRPIARRHMRTPGACEAVRRRLSGPRRWSWSGWIAIAGK